MAIQMPRVLTNFSVFIDGRGYIGRATKITLPKLVEKTEDYQAGGMDGPIEIGMGMEKLEASLDLGDFSDEVYCLFGKINTGGTTVTVRGAFQAQGQGEVPVVATMRGGFREIDGGDWEKGKLSAMTIACALTYYRLTMAGTDLVEIDLHNLVRKIGGFDQLAEQRAAIGM